MKISVIVPVYNEERFLATCLDSVMAQRDRPDEIVVVDNNSTDRTVQVAERYPVKVIAEKRQGIIPARNAGFDAASGDVLARCDADCILPLDWVSTIRANFARNRIVGLSGGLTYYDHPVFRHTSLYSRAFMELVRVMIGHPTLIGPNMAVSKEGWEQARADVCLDDHAVHEDIDLAIHLSKYGRIANDWSLVVQASSRRLKSNPLSFFVEYPVRLAKTVAPRRHPRARRRRA